MPPFPGLGYPLAPGYETVGTVARVCESPDIRVGDTVFVPDSYSPRRAREACEVAFGDPQCLKMMIDWQA